VRWHSRGRTRATRAMCHVWEAAIDGECRYPPSWPQMRVLPLSPAAVAAPPCAALTPAYRSCRPKNRRLLHLSPRWARRTPPVARRRPAAVLYSVNSLTQSSHTPHVYGVHALAGWPRERGAAEGGCVRSAASCSYGSGNEGRCARGTCRALVRLLGFGTGCTTLCASVGAVCALFLFRATSSRRSSEKTSSVVAAFGFAGSALQHRPLYVLNPSMATCRPTPFFSRRVAGGTRTRLAERQPADNVQHDKLKGVAGAPTGLGEQHHAAWWYHPHPSASSFVVGSEVNPTPKRGFPCKHPKVQSQSKQGISPLQ
jgi:hypothetical protein